MHEVLTEPRRAVRRLRPREAAPARQDRLAYPPGRRVGRGGARLPGELPAARGPRGRRRGTAIARPGQPPAGTGNLPESTESTTRAAPPRAAAPCPSVETSSRQPPGAGALRRTSSSATGTSHGASGT